MMNDKWLGRIVRAEFGFGGYDDAMMGLSLTFEGPSVGTSTFEGTWATRSERCERTVEDQRALFAGAVETLRDTLRAAKKRHVAQLVGVPVEVTVVGGRMESWRVLTEVVG